MTTTNTDSPTTSKTEQSANRRQNDANSKSNILVTGAAGQLGVELVHSLREEYGSERIIATDIRESDTLAETGPFELLDVLDKEQLDGIVREHRVGEIYHLAAILSAHGEKNIGLTWRLNMDGLLNVLDIARELPVKRIFWPSTIAVFGPDAPGTDTPQDIPLHPTTVYGISKVAGEHWCDYYHRRFGVDVRTVRYPGLIGYRSQPGGGTTDYAVELFYAALENKPFVSPLSHNTRLPMMYMDDAVKAARDIMHADNSRIHTRTGYNVGAMSFSPEELADAVRRIIPDFEIRYQPDERDEIASGWPDSLDDTEARADWGWSPDFNLDNMVSDIITNLSGKKATLSEKQTTSSGKHTTQFGKQFTL